MNFVIIETGGKQYKVSEGDSIKIEKLSGRKEGDKVVFDKVLLTDDGKGTEIGSPYLSGVSVSGTIKKEDRADKVEGIFYCLFFKALFSVSWSEYSSSVPVESPRPREEILRPCFSDKGSRVFLTYWNVLSPSGLAERAIMTSLRPEFFICLPTSPTSSFILILSVGFFSSIGNRLPKIK